MVLVTTPSVNAHATTTASAATPSASASATSPIASGVLTTTTTGALSPPTIPSMTVQQLLERQQSALSWHSVATGSLPTAMQTDAPTASSENAAVVVPAKKTFGTPSSSSSSSASSTSSSDNGRPHQQRRQPTPTVTSATPRSTPASPSNSMHWQSLNDLPERRLMVQRIIAMTGRKRAAVGSTRRERAENAASLAKRIELSLYSRAGSLNEYKNLSTLRRRLQCLVSLSFHEAAATKAATPKPVIPVIAASTTSSIVVGNKRPLDSPTSISTCFWADEETPESREEDVMQVTKRRRVFNETSVSRRHESHEIFASIGDDCLRNIFTFLDGKEVIAKRSINKYAAKFLPSCVRTLEVEVTQLQAAFAINANHLSSYENLEELFVYKKPNQVTIESVNQSLHAWGCSELDVSQDNQGELVVKQLAGSIEHGACSRLKRLQLVSVFTNTTRHNGIGALCRALSLEKCPQLEDLLIGGNSIADNGTNAIAALLKSRALPKLTRLDLRRNYIGEVGVNRIMAALSIAKLQELKYLCMGGNIITDDCILPMRRLLSSASCPQMRFLGLEDNFLSPHGVQSIIQAAVVGGMVPRLHRVSPEDKTAAASLA